MKTLHQLFIVIMTSHLTLCDVCRFDGRRKWLFCHERELERIPDDVTKTSEKLLLQNNYISEIEANKLLEFKNLKDVNFNNNLLERMPCLPEKLEVAEFSGNRITTLSPCSNLNNLRMLDLSFNNLTGYSLRGGFLGDLKNLQHLNFESNDLENVPAKLPTSLVFLNLKNNKIRKILKNSFLNVTELRVLSLEGNLIHEIESHPFANLNHLSTLNLNNNLIVEVPRKLPGRLNKLLMSRNNVEYLHSEWQLNNMQVSVCINKLW